MVIYKKGWSKHEEWSLTPGDLIVENVHIYKGWSNHGEWSLTPGDLIVENDHT